ncbi:MAG: acetylesterase [Pseudobutyrivibrio sp.]|nr:acetylesterase [Pseudobutyrivibrio sp.]
MAFITMSLLSESLKRTVPVNVILPADKLVFPGQPKREDKPFKTLYLLHGILGNYTDWVNGTRIARWAEENNLAVVMPSGDNAFYVDQPWASNMYGEFIGKELVELTRKIFPLSHDREDTFIGGLSMGGFGALCNGLKYSDTFGYVVALSGAYVMESFPTRTNDTPMFMERRDYAESMFGDLEEALLSDKNPKVAAANNVAAGKVNPKIYMACGRDDSLLDANKDMYEDLKAKGLDVQLVIDDGNHEWDFWDKYLKIAIDEFLPTEIAENGINSGNIGK